jgi:hypothetical protein
MAHEGVFKSRTPPSQRVDVRRLDDRISIAADGADRLVVREEEDNIRTFIRMQAGSAQKTGDEQQ